MIAAILCFVITIQWTCWDRLFSQRQQNWIQDANIYSTNNINKQYHCCGVWRDQKIWNMGNLKPSWLSRIFTQNMIVKWGWLSITYFYSFFIFNLFCSVDFLPKRRTSDVKSQQERMVWWFCQNQDFSRELTRKFNFTTRSK